VRHQFDGTAAINRGPTGARVGVTWRGRSTLESRIAGKTEELRFSPLLLVNLRAFTEASELLGRSAWTERMRLSLNVINLTNDRQAVRDVRGDTPLQYQPAYRDALGRTVELELRKVF
jgi:outer membrane receptor protein involved in Fe transport